MPGTNEEPQASSSKTNPGSGGLPKPLATSTANSTPVAKPSKITKARPKTAEKNYDRDTQEDLINAALLSGNPVLLARVPFSILREQVKLVPGYEKMLKRDIIRELCEPERISKWEETLVAEELEKENRA